MSNIHKTAIVEDGARLGADVTVGAYSIVGPETVLGDGVVVHPHVSIAGRTTVGAGTTIHPFASLGGIPQSVHYKGEAGAIEIGEKCIIREYVTINIGTTGGKMVTTIGNGCFLMTSSHVAHDCVIGNNVIMANGVALGGHVWIGDNVFLGGISAVHQFARVGEHAMIGGLCAIWNDIIPFGAIKESAHGLGGLNIIGLKRRGFSRASIHALRAAYRDIFYGPGSLAERVDRVASQSDDPNVLRIVDFVRNRGKRQLTTPRDAADTVTDEE